MDDPYDVYDWYYWDAVRKSGKLVADAAWARKQRRERRRSELLTRFKRWASEVRNER